MGITKASKKVSKKRVAKKKATKSVKKYANRDEARRAIARGEF